MGKVSQHSKGFLFRSSIVIIMLVSCRVLQSVAGDVTYIGYHQSINKAESLVFVRNQPDAGLAVYRAVFRDYDFVYVGDCITAMQIALFRGNEALFLEFTNKAFANGHRKSHFRYLKYIRNHDIYIRNKLMLDSLYPVLRARYLSRIDTAALNDMCRLFANDQLVKNGLNGGNESQTSREKRYGADYKTTWKSVLQLIRDKGFPSDRLLGIDQNSLIRELRLKTPDLIDYYQAFKAGNATYLDKGQFVLDDYSFSSTLILYIWIHGNILKDNPYYFFDTSFYKHQIALGNIHPKDIAMINDGAYGYRDQQIDSTGVYFGVGLRASHTPNSLFMPDSMLNRCRAMLFIAPVEQDRAKWKFMEQHQMFYGWGYVGTRS